MSNSLSPRFSNLKEMVKSLEDQHKVTTTIANNATVAMFMMNDKGFCTFLNPAAEKMVGFTIEELQEKPLHYMIHHHHPDGTLFPMEECPIDKALPTNNSVRAHQDVFIRKDGTFFPVSCAASPIFENGIPVATIIEVKDLTEEKKAEKALQDSEEKFRFMAESMPQMFWTTRPDGYADYYNQKWVDFTGLEKEKLYGYGWLETVHPEDREKTAQTWNSAVENKKEYQVEYRVRRADGIYKWHLTRGIPRLKENGGVHMWVGSTTDIDDQKMLVDELVTANEEMAAASEREQQAYMKAETQRQMLHNVFMDAPAAIAIVRGAELRFELANEPYKKLMPGKEFLGKTVKEAFPELESQGIFDILQNVFDTGVPFIGNEIPLQIDRHNTGKIETIYFNFTYQPYYDGNKIDGIIAFAYEVTDLVKAKASLGSN